MFLVLFMQEWQKNGQSKVLHPKYDKHGLFALAEKVQFKAKIDILLLTKCDSIEAMLC